MKIDRLVAIMNYLLRHGKTSAQRLAEEFEVSPRTIARDMESLGQAGIPIQSAFGADGGYSIVDTCVIDKKIMNREDYNHIITGLYALLSVYRDEGVVQNMDKVGSLYGNKDCPIQLDFSVANEKHEINERVRTLEKAIRTIEIFNRKAEDFHDNCGILRLDLGSSDEKSELIYEILSLVTKPFYGWFECPMIASKAAVYAVDRIEALKKAGYEKSEKPLIGSGNIAYYDYWVKRG